MSKKNTVRTNEMKEDPMYIIEVVVLFSNDCHKFLVNANFWEKSGDSLDLYIKTGSEKTIVASFRYWVCALVVDMKEEEYDKMVTVSPELPKDWGVVL